MLKEKQSKRLNSIKQGLDQIEEQLKNESPKEKKRIRDSKLKNKVKRAKLKLRKMKRAQTYYKTQPPFLTSNDKIKMIYV